MSEKMTVLNDLNCAESYCSLKGATREEKMAMYNAVNSPDYKLSDYTGKVIGIKDVVIEQIQLADEKTGEVKNQARVVLIDGNGKSYQCVSNGIYNSIKKIISIFGEPTWDEVVVVEVQNLSTAKGRKTLTLKAV